MTTKLTQPDELISLWRSGVEVAGLGNPAGPLYTSGRWAESDLVATAAFITRCSSCTASRTSYCC
jgi:hypothetical protein